MAKKFEKLMHYTMTAFYYLMHNTMDFQEFRQSYYQIRYCDDIKQAFQVACQNGNLDLAKKLNSAFSIDMFKINDSTYRYYFSPKKLLGDYVFINACTNGHLEMAQWLKSTWPNINHKVDENRAFFNAIRSEKFEIAEWLVTLYTVDDISPIIVETLCIENMVIIEFIIEYFNIEEITVDRDYQHQLNICIRNYWNRIHSTKSSRKS